MDLSRTSPVSAASAPAQTADGAARRYDLQQHYIDGGFRPSVSGATFETLNPTTNEVLALAAAGEAADVDAAVAAARRPSTRARGRG